MKETGAKGCYIVDVDVNHSAKLTFYSLDEVRWFREQISIDDIQDEEDFNLKLSEIMDGIRLSRPEIMSIIRFEIIGRGSLHRVLENGHFTDEMLQELRRRAIRDAELGHCKGIVWVEGISVQSGSELNRAAMLQEDSFLGEMLRLAERAELEADVGEDLVQKALAPLMSNKALRKLLGEIGVQERNEWLNRSSELAAMLMLDPDLVGGMKA
ncbi:hypothetical protein [Paenibacillus pini]|uniref:DNA double-strand break repair protein Mre11 n=1 Tax=Paenibacillus pini JCM 16418 TaxID=1236976 RepID=W7YG41_9BACL|nr:hypothetical protein [Paenibacillus pini]GAF06513.1 DNA double-strand break repair protein Mre11 [Paenibacillus pini JCM 16418]